MNVPMLLSPKSEVRYLYNTYTLRQGIEVMKAHGYTALPVIDSEGKYVGSVNEGDFLWYIVGKPDEKSIMRLCESKRIGDILRADFSPAVNINTDIDSLIESAMHQNFVPVVDDRGTFIGIVTRRTLIRELKRRNDAVTVEKDGDGE